MEYIKVKHNFDPVFDQESRILILGSFPSVKSREQKFFYGHPQNRFWKVLAAVLETKLPETIEEKKAMLLANHVALWDVIASCSIQGSSDTSIRDVVVNDFSVILEKSPIKRIYVNGGKAYQLYKKYALKETGIEAIQLPSTSPANAAWSLERLIQAWKDIIEIRN